MLHQQHRLIQSFLFFLILLLSQPIDSLKPHPPSRRETSPSVWNPSLSTWTSQPPSNWKGEPGTFYPMCALLLSCYGENYDCNRGDGTTMLLLNRCETGIQIQLIASNGTSKWFQLPPAKSGSQENQVYISGKFSLGPEVKADPNVVSYQCVMSLWSLLINYCEWSVDVQWTHFCAVGTPISSPPVSGWVTIQPFAPDSSQNVYSFDLDSNQCSNDFTILSLGAQIFN